MDVEDDQLNEERQSTDNVGRKKRNAKYRIVHGSSVKRRRQLHYQLHASSEKRKLKERRARRRLTELAEKSAIVEAPKYERQNKYRKLHPSSDKRRRQIRYKHRVSSEKRNKGRWRAAHHSVERHKRRARYIANADKEKTLFRSYYDSHIDQMRKKNFDWFESNSLKRRQYRREQYLTTCEEAKVNARAYYIAKKRNKVFLDRTKKIRLAQSGSNISRILCRKYYYLQRGSSEWKRKCCRNRLQDTVAMFVDAYKKKLPKPNVPPTDEEIRATVQLKYQQVEQVRKIVVASLMKKILAFKRKITKIDAEIPSDIRANKDEKEAFLFRTYCGSTDNMYHVRSHEAFAFEKDRQEYFSSLNDARQKCVEFAKDRKASAGSKTMKYKKQLQVLDYIKETSAVVAAIPSCAKTPEKTISSPNVSTPDEDSLLGGLMSSRKRTYASIEGSLEKSQEPSRKKTAVDPVVYVFSDDDRTRASFGDETSKDVDQGFCLSRSPNKRSVSRNLSIIFSSPDKGNQCLFSPEAINVDKTDVVTDDALSVDVPSIKIGEVEQTGKKIIDKKIYRCCLCDMRTNWATTLHEALLQLVGTEGRYESMRNALVAFESCDKCDPSTYPNCLENNSCTDQLKWLRFMSQHSSKLRSFLRRFYEIRMDHIWLLRCEFAVDFGQWEEFERLTEEAPYTLASKSVSNTSETRPNIWAHSAISESSFEAIKEFERAVHDFPVKFCHICTELKHGLKELNDLSDYLAMDNRGRFKQPTSARVAQYVEEKYADEAKLLDSLTESTPSDPIDEICEQVARGACTAVAEILNLPDVDLPEFEKMLESHVPTSVAPTIQSATMVDSIMASIEAVVRQMMDKEPDSADLCSILHPKSSLKRTFKYRICASCLFDLKNDKLPACCDLNEMGVDPIPPEIAELNSIELTLIKLARSFQCVTRLTPTRQCGPNADHVFALKGLTVHLPLPMEETHQYVCQTLPSTENMEIIVDNIPNNKKTIWRSLVSMEKVKRALAFLMKNNRLYADVKNLFEDIGDATMESINQNPPIHQLLDDNSNQLPQEQLSSILQLSTDKTMYSNVTVVPVDVPRPNIDDITLYRTEKVKATPIFLDNAELDMKCFPELYPRGRFGMYVDRPVKVGPPKFLHHVFCHKDARFRHDAQFLLQELHRYDDRAVKQGIYAMMKSSSLRDLTAEKLRLEISEKNQQLEANLSTLMSKVRGSKEYWCQRNGDLACMDEILGPATFFVTLSCAEYYWSDMRSFLEIMNSDLPDVEKMRIGSLCVNDPVSVAIHFKRRIEGFISAVLKNKEGPLGEVVHYFIRVEYQMRGAPHVHMKVWCEDKIDGIPVVGESTNEQIQAFVEKYITCAIPSRTENPKLRELVLAFQCHTCGKGCKRNFVVKGNKVLTKCRHGFPRAPSTNFQVSSFKESMASRKSAHRRNEKLYTLVRNFEERFINDYNPTLLMLWQANIDIQLVSENSFCLNSYITSYITKKEKSATDDLWAAVKDSNPSLYAQLHKFARMTLKNREIGAYEAVDKLLGHPLFYSSDAVMYLSVMPHNKRKRRIKPFKELEQLRADSANVFFDNLLDTYYPKRSLSLEDVSLYVIATEYEFERSKEDAKKQAQQTRRAADERDAFYVLLDGSGFFRKRKSHPKILKTPRFSLKTDAGLENHFHALLMLFKPWRKEDELLGDEKSFSKAYLACCDKYSAMEEFHRRKMQTETARELAISIALEAERKAEEEQSNVDAANELAFEEETEKVQDKFADAPYTAPSEEEYEKMVKNLNQEQRKIFDQIHSVIKAQKFDEKSELPIKMIVSGVAGTGKSFLIEVLIAAIRRLYPTSESDPSPVAVLAPTGIAAFNIRGWTIHGYFKLNVQHGKDGALFTLSPDDQKMFRAKWSAVKLIIIDEFSMVSNSTLAKIHSRLSNVLDGDDFNCAFAGKNIVMFGDLLQLPPVNAQFCFEDLSSKLCGEILDSIGGYNLWHDFSYSELQENMRQQDDLAYAQMLNRIRIGSPTEEDIELLKERIVEVPSLFANKKLAYIAEKFNKENDDAQNSICLLPLNVQVDEFNQTMLELKKIKVEEIYAEDKQKSKAKKSKKTTVPVTKDIQQKKKKTSDTGSLEECLKIGVGVRVMLRRNLNVGAGLVNGSLGTVKEIKKINGQVEVIDVEFDASKKRVKIEKVTAEFEISPRVYVTRKQFPLCLAYAITIHKSQGLTLDQVLIDLGSSCFEDAMAYVALSRAWRLSKVHLLDFEPTVINCKRIAVEEYDRLRQSIGLPKLPPYNQRPDKYKKLTSRNVMAEREIIVSAITSKRPMRKRKMHKDAGQISSTILKPQSNSSLQEVQSVTLNVHWLPFENEDSVSCYANSIVQALLQLKDLPEYFGSGNDASKLLRSFFTTCASINSHVHSFTTFHLRSFVTDAPDTSSREDFRAHQQQDASEFFEALLQSLPAATSNCFQFNQVKTQHCSNPNCSLLPTFTDSPSHVLHALLKEDEVCSKENAPKFIDMVPRSVMDNLPSTKCELCGQPKMDVTETRLAPAQKYLVVRLELFQTSKKFVGGSQRMLGRMIKNFNANRMNILGKNFRTVAAIKHTGDTPASGHYSTWIRSGLTDWVEVNDDRCSTPRLRFVDNLKDISILLLEKL